MHLSRTFALRIAAAACALLSLAAPMSAPNAAAAKAKFIDREGRDVGTAQLTQTASGVLIELEVRGLQPGEHGFHIHEKGSCDSADGFSSAGSHLAMHGQQHGYEAAEGPHAGDLPNQHVGEDGKLRADVIATSISLEGEQSVFDEDGAALVIHAKADDYRSQPSGEAGERVACAVIEAQ